MHSGSLTRVSFSFLSSQSYIYATFTPYLLTKMLRIPDRVLATIHFAARENGIAAIIRRAAVVTYSV